MHRDEIDKIWSQRVAVLAADALVDAGFVTKSDFDSVTRIIAEEVSIRLLLEDRPANQANPGSE